MRTEQNLITTNARAVRNDRKQNLLKRGECAAESIIAKRANNKDNKRGGERPVDRMWFEIEL